MEGSKCEFVGSATFYVSCFRSLVKLEINWFFFLARGFYGRVVIG